MFFGVSLMGSRLCTSSHNAKHTPPLPHRLNDDGSSEEESGKHYYVSSEIHFQDTETHSRLKGGGASSCRKLNIFISFFTSAEAVLELRGDEICLAYPIYCSIIHRVFSGKKSSPIRERALISKRRQSRFPICLHDVKPATGY